MTLMVGCMDKSLKEISWLVSEEEYRKDPALSYSTLARFEREGFNNIDRLFDKIETPSLTFGSAVDSLITGGEEEFNSRFMVAEFPNTPDSIVAIVKCLFNKYSDKYNSLIAIPDSIVIEVAETHLYQNNWKPETRAKVIKEKGSAYYNLLYLSEDKIILDSYTYKDVINAVDTLKTSEATKKYFAIDNPFDNIERYYQLKFKANLTGINYRCMADLIIVDYKRKIIYPVDLKTSGKSEWDFYKSFIDWSYAVQARLYWRIIRDNLDKDPYFKDFELANYKFIVINRKTLTPLVWEFDNTKDKGTLQIGDYTFKDPEDIGRELNYYLTDKSSVPIGINPTGINSITNWLKR